jgi:hypothetical protein
MAETSELWYYRDGAKDVSSVPVSLDDSIAKLKRKIHENAPAGAGFNPDDLVLIKVRYIMILMNTECNQWPLLA